MEYGIEIIRTSQTVLLKVKVPIILCDGTEQYMTLTKLLGVCSLKIIKLNKKTVISYSYAQCGSNPRVKDG